MPEQPFRFGGQSMQLHFMPIQVLWVVFYNRDAALSAISKDISAVPSVVGIGGAADRV